MGARTMTMEEANRIAQQRIAELEEEVERLEDFVALCKSLTGSLWPQNETTELLAKQLAALQEGE